MLNAPNAVVVYRYFILKRLVKRQRYKTDAVSFTKGQFSFQIKQKRKTATWQANSKNSSCGHPTNKEVKWVLGARGKITN